MKNNNIIDPDIQVKIRIEDKKYSDLSKGFQILYWFLAVAYTLLIVSEVFIGGNVYEIIGGVCYLFAMLIFALIFKYYHKVYNSVDYGEPVLTMLKRAKKRYEPFQWNQLWLVPAIGFIDTGLILNSFKDTDVLMFQIFFFSGLALSFGIGVIYWYIRYKPLYDEIKGLIKDIES
jgi:hypothetical protein